MWENCILRRVVEAAGELVAGSKWASASVALASATRKAWSENRFSPGWTTGQSLRIAVTMGGFIPDSVSSLIRTVAEAAAVAVVRALSSSKEVNSEAKEVAFARKPFTWEMRAL